MNLGGSTPHGSGGMGPILSPPPGPHTFQPGHSLPPGGLPPGSGGHISGFGSSSKPVASPGSDDEMSETEGLCQVSDLI